ncbi:uncharacterized protein F4812DRAFT_454479 [Daldinia caldariorum]|uniref:uncharacterized protein n=1 Tax=Daldinia caldariorum TaxID=326644 RepID=UPI002008A1AB|nr:uncharacterized protein F4812DRAFT_454479 [Daldinia caldariorum]KAI1472664.1 hypothetical protein F4812DRAFT_454479 [Daldinia caldariorum]
MYNPICAYACQYSFGSNPLVCTDEASFDGSGMGGMNIRRSEDGIVLPQNVSAMPSSTCHAESEPFLTSVAWCIHEKCDGEFIWKIEKWWQSYVVGNSQSDPPPSLSYGAALALVSSRPNSTCSSGQILNEKCLVDETLYHAQHVSLNFNQNIEIQHERFGLVILLSGVVIPVGFSLLRFLPFPKRWASALSGHFIYPSLLRPWRNSPVAAVVGDPPTRGQALFIGYLILLNIFLSVQHSTFVLLHRWVAHIAILEAILHSLIFLHAWIRKDRLEKDQVLPYWWWGCIATIAASLVLPLSIPLLRQRSYELFLAIHIVAAILIFLGSWYHIIHRYEHQWGYETWLYVVFAVWGFDRLIRLLRVLRNGVRTANITVINSDYVRIDIKGVVGAGHVYLYFLDWRFWENHPFSIVSSVIQQGDTSLNEENVSQAKDVVLGGAEFRSQR